MVGGKDTAAKTKPLISKENARHYTDNTTRCLLTARRKTLLIGIYGQRRRVYLKEHYRVLYYKLLTTGVLDGHLADIEEQAQELFLRLVEQYADTEGVTEALKADDPMAWVRKMNGIRHRANEVVMQEIVYG